MSEQPRLVACDARQPVSGSPLVPAQGLELSARPPRQSQVDALQGWIEGRRAEPPIVVDPATNARVEHPRGSSRVLSLRRCIDQLRTVWRIAVSAFVLTAGLNETPIPPDLFAHHPRPESVTEKVELRARVVFTATFILAIDNFRLVRMQCQSAFSKPRLKSSPQRRGLVFGTTVTNRIIGIALELYVRKVPAHPQVERIVQKENLFLHYAFHVWMARTWPAVPFERYADDAICEVSSMKTKPRRCGLL